jgi:hypothetical protein
VLVGAFRVFINSVLFKRKANFLIICLFPNNKLANSQAASYSMPDKDRNSVIQEERVEPCHLSSSLYYGGQENYSQSPSTQMAGSYPIVSL